MKPNVPPESFLAQRLYVCRWALCEHQLFLRGCVILLPSSSSLLLNPSSFPFFAAQRGRLSSRKGLNVFRKPLTPQPYPMCHEPIVVRRSEHLLAGSTWADSRAVVWSCVQWPSSAARVQSRPGLWDKSLWLWINIVIVCPAGIQNTLILNIPNICVFTPWKLFLTRYVMTSFGILSLPPIAADVVLRDAASEHKVLLWLRFYPQKIASNVSCNRRWSKQLKTSRWKSKFTVKHAS